MIPLLLGPIPLFLSPPTPAPITQPLQQPKEQIVQSARLDVSRANVEVYRVFPLPPDPDLPFGAAEITPEYARRLWRVPLPLPPAANASVDLIVSRCKESPAWISSFAPQLSRLCKLRVIIYEKCLEGVRGVVSEDKEPFHLLKIALPNVGYEGHTFLHHILTEKSFPDFVFFLQGHDPRHHMRERDIDLLDYFRCLIQRPELYLRNGFRYVSDERWEFFLEEQACWEGYYQAIFDVPRCPPVLGTLCCSAFVVTKERLAAVPRIIFERAMRFMNGTVLPKKLREPKNSEDRKAQKIFDTIKPLGFWSNLEAGCKTPKHSHLGYCAGALARHKIEGVQIEHLWQTMLGEPYWLPPNAFPNFEPLQLRSHLWKKKDPQLNALLARNFSGVYPRRYHAQIFSPREMDTAEIKAHLKSPPPPTVQC